MRLDFRHTLCITVNPLINNFRSVALILRLVTPSFVRSHLSVSSDVRANHIASCSWAGFSCRNFRAKGYRVVKWMDGVTCKSSTAIRLIRGLAPPASSFWIIAEIAV